MDDEQVPSFSEKADLALSGLGEKKITFPAEEELTVTVLREFPLLQEGGGFEILRSNGKFLKPLPSPLKGYTVEFLRGVLAQAKGYIRPLQRNLMLEKTEVGLTSKANYCKYLYIFIYFFFSFLYDVPWGRRGVGWGWYSGKGVGI